jgi:hypothetical protein
LPPINAGGAFSADIVIQGNRKKREDAQRPQEASDVPAPLDYLLNPTRRLISVKFRRKVQARDIERYASSLRAHPQFDPEFSEIVDLSEVEEVDLQADEFIRLADEVDPFSLKAKRAFVARNSVQTHAARMHKILRTQRNFEIFRSLAEAERWIES